MTAAAVKSPARWPQLGDTEGAFQQWVVATARANGYRVHITLKRLRRASLVADPDWPDLEIVGKGQIIYAELKSVTGKLTVGQAEVLQLLAEAGAETHIWDPRDAEAILRRLT